MNKLNTMLFATLMLKINIFFNEENQDIIMEQRVVSEDLEAGTRQLAKRLNNGYCAWGEMLVDGQWVKHGVYTYVVVVNVNLERTNHRITEHVYNKGNIIDTREYIEHYQMYDIVGITVL